VVFLEKIVLIDLSLFGGFDVPVILDLSAPTNFTKKVPKIVVDCR